MKNISQSHFIKNNNLFLFFVLSCCCWYSAIKPMSDYGCRIIDSLYIPFLGDADETLPSAQFSWQEYDNVQRQQAFKLLLQSIQMGDVATAGVNLDFFLNENNGNTGTEIVVGIREEYKNWLYALIAAFFRPIFTWYEIVPLHVATVKNKPAIVQLCLAKKIPADWRYNGKTCLHVASQKGLAAIARILMEHGADVEAADNDNYRPIHLAAAGGFLDIVTELLKHHANVYITAPHGQTALSLSQRNGHTEVAGTLQEYIANNPKPY